MGSRDRFIMPRDDDASSVSSLDSYDNITPRPRRFDTMPKIDGKSPGILYSFQFYGRYDRLVEERLSTKPFTRVPQFPRRNKNGEANEADGGDEDDKDPEEGPVLEIVYSVDLKRHPRVHHRRARQSPPPFDRPVTSAFDPSGYNNEAAYSSDEDVSRRHSHIPPTPSMMIHSKHLLSALRAVVKYYPDVNMHDQDVSFEVKAPYSILYHHRQELVTYRDNQPVAHSAEYVATTARHINLLLEFLETSATGLEIRREEERHRQTVPVATFESFWLLLKPGSVVYSKVSDVWEAFVVSRVFGGGKSSTSPYSIDCWYLESNGTKVNRYMTTFSAQRWSGEQPISNLSIVPEAYWKENLEAQKGLQMRELMISYGKTYWDLLKRPTYMEHEGILVSSTTKNAPAAGVTGFMSGRVICDVSGFDMYYDNSPINLRHPRHHPPGRRPLPPPKDPLPSHLPRCGCEACQESFSSNQETAYSEFFGFEDLNPQYDAPPASDIFYLVCKKTIPGFILSHRHWGQLHLGSLRPVRTDREAFKYLVLDEEIKLTVRALIGKYATESNGTVSPWGNDFVKNKGEGRILLLHGTPGVGKTCTAECIAELTSRPLISLTSGDLGVNNLDVEENLNYFLELGQRYGALVLLDEADVYLERRHGRDIWRNGLVSIFLRALEYYRGVLFLTTNRVQSFDSAFLSRIHVSLHYKNLRDEDRERIWVNNFERLERDSSGKIHVSNAAKDFVWSSDEVRRLEWNGREIRNAMQTALALAEYDATIGASNKVIIGEKHIKAVVKMSKDFRDTVETNNVNLPILSRLAFDSVQSHPHPMPHDMDY